MLLGECHVEALVFVVVAAGGCLFVRGEVFGVDEGIFVVVESVANVAAKVLT